MRRWRCFATGSRSERVPLAEETVIDTHQTHGKATVALKRELGFRDLVLFYVVSSLSLRWIASAAASGPSSIAVWLLALFGFFLPLAASVLEMSSRYPDE